jgi:hypothetical protein
MKYCGDPNHNCLPMVDKINGLSHHGYISLEDTQNWIEISNPKLSSQSSLLDLLQGLRDDK